MDEQSNAVNESASIDTSATESATVESQEVEVTTIDTGELSSADAEETEQKPEQKTEEESTEESKEETEEEVESPAERRKQQLNNEIRDLANQRRALKQQVEQLHAQTYRPASVQELMNEINPATGEYYTPVEAEVAAMRQEQQVREYNESVTENRLSLMTEATAAIRDFPMFDSQSAEYQNLPTGMKQVVQAADQVLEAAKIVDQNTGEIIGSNISPYALYQAIGLAFQQGQSAGNVKGQQTTAQMLARADSMGASAPQKETPFANLSASEMRERLMKKGYDIN